MQDSVPKAIMLKLVNAVKNERLNEYLNTHINRPDMLDDLVQEDPLKIQARNRCRAQLDVVVKALRCAVWAAVPCCPLLWSFSLSPSPPSLSLSLSLSPSLPLSLHCSLRRPNPPFRATSLCLHGWRPCAAEPDSCNTQTGVVVGWTSN